jgi:hypothetical protein
MGVLGYSINAIKLASLSLIQWFPFCEPFQNQEEGKQKFKNHLTKKITWA